MSSDITVADPKNAIKVTAENDYNTTIIIDKRRRFLQSLFPTKLQQAFNKSELLQAKTELEFREKALKMAKESQLQAIKETYNDFLVRGKGDTRGDRVVFFANLDRISIPFF